MTNLIETQRVYKILKSIIKRMKGQNVYEDSLVKVYHLSDTYTIISQKDPSRFMSITHKERSVHWSVPEGVSVLSIQKIST